MNVKHNFPRFIWPFPIEMDPSISAILSKSLCFSLSFWLSCFSNFVTQTGQRKIFLMKIKKAHRNIKMGNLKATAVKLMIVWCEYEIYWWMKESQFIDWSTSAMCLPHHQSLVKSDGVKWSHFEFNINCDAIHFKEAEKKTFFYPWTRSCAYGTVHMKWDVHWPAHRHRHFRSFRFGV